MASNPVPDSEPCKWIDNWISGHSLALSGAPTLTVCERERRNEMEEQEANDQNKSPEAPREYKLPEACNLLDVQMKDSDWLET